MAARHVPTHATCPAARPRAQTPPSPRSLPLHCPRFPPQRTIGDCYFVAGGLMQTDADGMAGVRDGTGEEDPLHTERVFRFAKVR